MSASSRLARRLTRPVSRPAALFLLWSHRRTLALWGRSAHAEFQRGRTAGHDPQRWKTLVTALWRVSKESTLLQENELRRLIVTREGPGPDDTMGVVAAVGAEPVDRVAFARAGVEPVPG